VLLAHGGTAAAYAALAGLGLGTPLVWQRILEFPQQVMLSRSRRLAWAWIGSRCAGVVALTDRAGSEMRQLGYSGPLTVIPNHRPVTGLPGDSSWPGTLRATAIPEGTPVLAFVGHLVPQKDPLAAVRVAERVLEQAVDAHFVMAGDGPLRADVEEAVASSPHRSRMHVLGHVDDAPGEVLRAARVVLITSATESMTGVAVECVVAGCPVVAYDLDGLDVLLQDTGAGVLVEHGDEPALAEALVHVLSSAETQEAMRAAALAQRDRFSTGTVARRYDQFLSDVVDRRAGSPSARPMPVDGDRAGCRTVAHVMPNLGVGGAEQALAVLAGHMDRERWDPVVITLHEPRRPRQETILPTLDRLGVRVIDLQLPGRADRSPAALVLAVRTLRKCLVEHDVSIVDSALFEADLVSRVAVLGRPVRHVTHLVNTTYDPVVHAWSQGRGAWRSRVVRSTDRLSGRRSDRFVALTHAVKESAQKELGLPAEKVRVVPRGVDLSRFPRVRLSDAPVRRILCVGRLVPQKNHRTLLDGLAQTEHLELTILGEGPLGEEILAHVEDLGLAGRVRLAEPTRDVAAVHAEHDAFVIPSLWEGQSNALLEAMSSGLPVVAADIPVFREVLGDLSLFVDPEDAADVARGLRELHGMSLSARMSMSEALRDRVETRFSAQSATRQLEAVYGELFDGLGPG